MKIQSLWLADLQFYDDARLLLGTWYSEVLHTIKYSSCIKKHKFISGYTVSDVGVGRQVVPNKRIVGGTTSICRNGKRKKGL